jgi:hypothetical protein
MDPSSSMNDPRRLCAFVVLALAASSACSPASGKPVSTGAARGALSVHVFAGAGQSCSVAEHTANVPPVSGALPVLDASAVQAWIDDGPDGRVECTIAESSGSFSVDALISSGPYTFTLRSIVGPGQSDATADLTESDSDVLIDFANPLDVPCILSVAGGSLGVEPGGIWAAFSCEQFVVVSQAGQTCTADTGYVRLENCLY